jgi:hypothetical protein
MFGYELNLIGVWWVSGRNATGLARDVAFVESVIFGERVMRGLAWLLIEIM